jgi:homoserine dehydrogenase
VAGILNGTVNYILDRLARGATFPQALAEARLAGFAEEDPSEDLSGADAAAKLKLIAHEAFGIDPAELQVRTEALDAEAVARIQKSGQRWIQLARLDRTGSHISASVSLRPRQDVESLPHVDDEWNCIAATFADGTYVRCLGPGAGGIPTAGSILSDLAVLAAAADASAETASAC